MLKTGKMPVQQFNVNDFCALTHVIIVVGSDLCFFLRTHILLFRF